MSEFDAIPHHADTSSVASKVKSEQELQLKAIDAARDRQAQLRRALTEMVQSPQSVRLDTLIISYQAAQLSEVNFAADTIAALYLRSGLATRRRLRIALSAAIQEQPSAALGLALTVRLGTLVMPVTPSPP